MKTKLLALLLLAGGTVFAGPRWFVGVNLGEGGGYYDSGYYAPPPPVYYAPPAVVRSGYTRPGYTWVAGYWYPVGPRYVWHTGYWARQPYAGAAWICPRYHGHRYYRGYWR